MHLRRINKHDIKPIYIPGYDLPVKGSEILPDPFGTVFTIAKRRSGKTNVLFHIIKNCITKDTEVLVFCSSVYNDDNWKEIRKYLEKKGNKAEYFTSIHDDGENQIIGLLEELRRQEQEKEEEEQEEESTTEMVIKHLDKFKQKKEGDDEEPKKRKPKWLVPDYLIIFDDISAELRSPPVVKLLKEGRHYKLKILCSSQSLKDINPASREQIGTWLVFKGQPEEKLKSIYEIAEVHEPF